MYIRAPQILLGLMQGLDSQRHNNRNSQELQQLHSHNKDAQKTQLRQNEQQNSQWHNNCKKHLHHQNPTTSVFIRRQNLPCPQVSRLD